jgi:hypothetical protein
VLSFLSVYFFANFDMVLFIIIEKDNFISKFNQHGNQIEPACLPLPLPLPFPFPCPCPFPCPSPSGFPSPPTPP